VNTEIKIRRATPSDAGLIVILSEVTFRETFNGTCTDADMDNFIKNCFSEKGILKELHNEDDFYFIAYLDEEPVGYTRLKEDYSDYPAMKKYVALELKRIYVLQKYHNRKIGAALMAHALELAVQKKFEAVWLGVWEFNEKAILFYKKRSFTDTGFTHTFHIGDTAQTDHWMIRLINS
jgi:ribosomal protein S18 acetylase RimI-like enzyme